MSAQYAWSWCHGTAVSVRPPYEILAPTRQLSGSCPPHLVDEHVEVKAEIVAQQGLAQRLRPRMQRRLRVRRDTSRHSNGWDNTTRHPPQSRRDTSHGRQAPFI